MPQWFKFLISSPLPCRQVMPPVSLSDSHLPSPGSLLFLSAVCCRKPSNEIHTKQDGRLSAFLLTVLSSSLLPRRRLFFFHIRSRSIYSSLLSSPSVLHTFLHLSLSPSFFSSASPSWFLLLYLFVFIRPADSLATYSCHFLSRPVFYISIPAGLTWKHIYIYLAIFPFLYLDKKFVCVCVCACVCARLVDKSLH